MAATGERPRTGSERRARRLEWVAAAIAGLAVLGLLAQLLRTAVFVESTPPELSVRLEPGGGPGLVGFRVTNAGGRSASAVALGFRAGEEPPRRLVVDYVPAGSEVTGALTVGNGAEVEAWVEGWVDP